MIFKPTSYSKARTGDNEESSTPAREKTTIEVKKLPEVVKLPELQNLKICSDENWYKLQYRQFYNDRNIPTIEFHQKQIVIGKCPRRSNRTHRSFINALGKKNQLLLK